MVLLNQDIAILPRQPLTSGFRCRLLAYQIGILERSRARRVVAWVVVALLFNAVESSSEAVEVGGRGVGCCAPLRDVLVLAEVGVGGHG